jgi:hypothetical protein
MNETENEYAFTLNTVAKIRAASIEEAEQKLQDYLNAGDIENLLLDVTITDVSATPVEPAPPENPWRTLAVGGVCEMFPTQPQAFAHADYLAKLTNADVYVEAWSSENPQDEVNQGWATVEVIRPPGKATDPWKCWRNPSHQVGSHHPFGWPQCTECGAAPQYYDRGKYLPEDFSLNVYIPSNLNVLGLATGSAIVGRPAEDGTIEVYYEGWVYGWSNGAASSMRDRWRAGLLQASDRMITAYPTAARANVPESALRLIGTYKPKTDVVAVDESALATWLGPEE